jgi:hypothetical protein
MTDPVRPIAMYLPQFHPIPENDQWWGEGFTEWTNVRKGLPRFQGHQQPHVPGALGYYDLRDPKTRAAQAALAREHGIHGFCYYHYWFNGRRLLETPFNEVLRTREPDYPFCLCWANENWTRAWDGRRKNVLMAQHYSDEDSLAFIQALEPAFQDERYIRVGGKPLLLVYRTGLLPEPARTAEIWREAMHRAGVGDLYLVRVETGLDGAEPAPETIGFDAAMEFAPRWRSMGAALHEVEGLPIPSDVRAYDYRVSVQNLLVRPMPHYKFFRGVFPFWDNTARRETGPTVFVHSSPELYAFWLSAVAAQTLQHHTGSERLLFINAWNEWGEGCHLEPDRAHGSAYLEATSRVLRQVEELDRAMSHGLSLLEANDGAIRNWYSALSEIQDRHPTPSDETVRYLEAHSNILSIAGPAGQAEGIARAQAELVHAKVEALSQIERTFSRRSARLLQRLWHRLNGSRRHRRASEDSDTSDGTR